MMMPNEGSSNITIDEFGSSGILLHDLEEISKALYLHDTPPKTSMQPRHTQQKPKYVNNDLLPNDKKSSIWKWKPLKALTHIRNHKLSCCFFLHIHSIEGLPINFNDLNLCVYWKRKHEVLKTCSIRVNKGIAEFEETLIHRCSVYVSKGEPHDDVAKYEPKLSLLYASVVGAHGLDIGKHWIDLTRLLPINLMELEEEKNRYGKWITSFKLTGKAKGAIINVSFGFSISGDNSIRPDKGNRSSHNSRHGTHGSNFNDIVTYKEGPSISLLYKLLDDAKSRSFKDINNSISNEVVYDDDDFTVIDKGIELSKTDAVNSFDNSCIETIDVDELFDGDDDNNEICDDIETENNMCTEESNIEELELFLHNLSISELPELDLSFQETQFLEHERGKMVKLCSLDDLTDTVVNDFMNLVGSDSEPDSPRECLLRQFEKENLDLENFGFDLDVKEEQGECSNIFNSSFLFQETEIKHDKEVGPTLISRRKAKMIENLETESLMEEWGLNERLFLNSPRTESGAFGSPVYLSPERPRELPPIGDGLGPFLKIRSGGFLRAMNPLIFKKAKNGERLIVQVSSSVVLPLAMGSTCMDTLTKWATVGPEKMIFQMTRLMPLEEITGKTLQQAGLESESEMELLERGHTSQTSDCCEIDSEYVSTSNIIPLAIERIQYLLIEGLRIQSGKSNEEPPSSIKSTSRSIGDIEEIIYNSISFDEWIMLNSATFDVNHEIGDPKSYDQNCGYFSNFTLALQLLLRDPLRDYEPVGIPMLALVQVESTSVDQMLKITEVHVTGFKVDFQKKQQSGSRWLNSSGMLSKKKKHVLTKSNALVRSSIRSMNMVKHEESLWSVSSNVHGEVRNPDILFK